MQLRVTAPADRLALEAAVELELYRLAKEALHNSVKHAGASAIHITVGENPVGSRRLALDVSDDGVGFDAGRPARGLGLVSMRERAERLGGQFALDSERGTGTTIRVVVPNVLAGLPCRSVRTEHPRVAGG